MQRKADHIRIVAEEAVQYKKSTLLECVELTHDALPELALDDIDTTVSFFGKQLALPMMITSMSGGTDEACKMNRALASVCAQTGIAFAVGSQRVMLDKPEQSRDFAVREQIPDGVLLGNIGAQQLLEYSVKDIAGLVSAIDADGLCIHLNPAHELAQQHGDRNFMGITDAIHAICNELEGRVLVKEVGSGIRPDVAKKLEASGVKYIDVAGSGGTSWQLVETHRVGQEPEVFTGSFRVGIEAEARELALAFGEWGIPTAPAILGVKNTVDNHIVIIGSGGVRSGLDVVKCIALGADIAGFAYPALMAYLKDGSLEVTKLICCWKAEIQTAMLLTGSKTVVDLQSCHRTYTGELASRLVELLALKRGSDDG